MLLRLLTTLSARRAGSAPARTAAGTVLALALLGAPGHASASFIYEIDRVIGATNGGGTVVGTIETAILGSFNAPGQSIVGGSLTITPNVSGSSPFTVDLGLPGNSTIVGVANVLEATATELLFNFNLGGTFFAGSGGNIWCLTGTQSCVGTETKTELIALNLSAVQSTSHNGQVTIGVRQVPEASTLALLGIGLLAGGLVRRRPRELPRSG